MSYVIGPLKFRVENDTKHIDCCVWNNGFSVQVESYRGQVPLVEQAEIGLWLIDFHADLEKCFKARVTD